MNITSLLNDLTDRARGRLPSHRAEADFVAFVDDNRDALEERLSERIRWPRGLELEIAGEHDQRDGKFLVYGWADSVRRYPLRFRSRQLAERAARSTFPEAATLFHTQFRRQRDPLAPNRATIEWKITEDLPLTPSERATVKESRRDTARTRVAEVPLSAMLAPGSRSGDRVLRFAGHGKEFVISPSVEDLIRDAEAGDEDAIVTQQKVQAALEAGYKLRNVEYESHGSGMVLVRESMVLTEAGANALLDGEALPDAFDRRMTKEELLSDTRKLWREAYAADPYHVDEIMRAVLSPSGKISADGVFAWDRLSVPELSRMRGPLYSVVLAARG